MASSTYIKYEVYAGKEFVRHHLGLVGACVDARTEAGYHPGIEYTVKYNGTLEARYKLVGKELVRWMR